MLLALVTPSLQKFYHYNWYKLISTSCFISVLLLHSTFRFLTSLGSFDSPIVGGSKKRHNGALLPTEKNVFPLAVSPFHFSVPVTLSDSFYRWILTPPGSLDPPIVGGSKKRQKGALLFTKFPLRKNTFPLALPPFRFTVTATLPDSFYHWFLTCPGWFD